MLSVHVNDQEVKAMLKREIEETVNNLDTELVFWDTNELKRRTCMSWNTIKERFFFDERFPKVKVGGKYYFPAQKTKEFLITWLDEQEAIFRDY
ncbi:group-specific protein [Halobacillus seohaensis]|uniref:Group-specific protein n=1 Tax=Halobacillus seohaensis TaxID=447421 RepID=A0ABW2EJT3_9BACI